MKNKRILCYFLLLSLVLSLAACSRTAVAGYEVIDRLDSEQFSIAFRYGDPLCEVVSAALEEVAADGLISRLSSQYLSADYSCLEGRSGALNTLRMDLTPGRVLRVGVEDGIAPLCWKDDSGNFIGLIPDMVEAVAEKLDWQIVYTAISSENVSVELASGNVDCAWLPASFDSTSTDYSLSPAWMENSHLVVVRQGSGLNRMRDLKGRNVGLVDNTARDALKNNSKIFDTLTIWNYTDLRSCFTALASGECDAVVIDSIVSLHYING